jgi:hypothetical protein
MILVILLFLILLATAITLLVIWSRRASANGRSLTTSFRESFLNVVPKPARTIAAVFLVCATLIGIIVGIIEASLSTPLAVSGDHFFVLWPILGFAMGLFIGSLFAAWILGLGYVYADARRRGMPYIPWTLIAAIVPNLLGFLLYFVLRKPIASPCPQCGQPVATGQRFCPACGYQAFSHPTAAPPPQPI